MNPIVKVVVAVSIIAFSLWWGVGTYLGSSDDLAPSLNVRNLAHLRDETVLSGEVDESAQQLAAAKPNLVVALKEPSTADDVPTESKAAAREQALMEKLGIRKPKPPTIAADVTLNLSSDCDAGPAIQAPVAVKFRNNSPTIRGESLNALEVLVAEFRQCESGIFTISANPQAEADTTPGLMQMRFDELKYYFLQHSVSRSALKFISDK